MLSPFGARTRRRRCRDRSTTCSVEATRTSRTVPGCCKRFNRRRRRACGERAQRVQRRAAAAVAITTARVQSPRSALRGNGGRCTSARAPGNASAATTSTSTRSRFPPSQPRQETIRTKREEPSTATSGSQGWGTGGSRAPTRSPSPKTKIAAPPASRSTRRTTPASSSTASTPFTSDASMSGTSAPTCAQCARCRWCSTRSFEWMYLREIEPSEEHAHRICRMREATASRS
mmetsp:Transcript_22177/g.71850  ORF Transcript_22177/g.71850 Transcript_22177/m.71850 type:complete len:232 (+) Transcript_22177:259-954(+)